MTKPEYTHVLIPKTLHSILKDNAKNENTSIWRYIYDLIRRDSQARYGAGLLTLCSARSSGVQVPLSSPSTNAGFSGNGASGETKEVTTAGINTKEFEKFLYL